MAEVNVEIYGNGCVYLSRINRYICKHMLYKQNMISFTFQYVARKIVNCAAHVAFYLSSFYFIGWRSDKKDNNSTHQINIFVCRFLLGIFVRRMILIRTADTNRSMPLCTAYAITDSSPAPCSETPKGRRPSLWSSSDLSRNN